MDYGDIMDRAEALAEEVIQTGTRHSARKLNLDVRCGDLVVGETWIATDNARTLDYYGGFEYVDDSYKTRIGSWTFYARDDDRVDSAITALEFSSD
jgi:hypothetical protein